MTHLDPNLVLEAFIATLQVARAWLEGRRKA